VHIYAKTKNGIETRHKAPYATPRFDSEGNEIFRDATLRDFKKWHSEGDKVAPSVTTVLDMFNKPALISWFKKETARTADEFPREQDETFNDWFKRIERLTKQRLDQAPKAGTNFHSEMENAIKQFQSNVLPKKHLNVIDLIQEKTRSCVSDWQTEINVFCDEYAGQCDLYIPVGEENDAWVIDFKTKETKDKFKPGKMAYWQSHLSQLMAYSAELDFEARVANVFVCLETGEIDFHEWTDEELKTKAWEYFMMGVNAWWIANV